MNSEIIKSILKKLSFLLAGAGVAGLGLVSLQTQAQDDWEEPPEDPPAEEAPAEDAAPLPDPPPAPDPEDISDEELEQAADAYFAVQEIQQELQKELADEEDQEVIQERINEARPEMNQAIADSGLEQADYEQIMQAVNQDDTLRMEFIQKVESRRPEDERKMPETSMDPDDITSEQISQAAEVYSAVSDLNQQLEEELAGVEDQAVIQEKVGEAEEKMMKIIDEVGLDPEKYGEIMQTIQQDEELIQEFMEHIEE